MNHGLDSVDGNHQLKIDVLLLLKYLKVYGYFLTPLDTLSTAAVTFLVHTKPHTTVVCLLKIKDNTLQL